MPGRAQAVTLVSSSAVYYVASHAGVFRGARISSPKNACVGGYVLREIERKRSGMLEEKLHKLYPSAGQPA